MTRKLSKLFKVMIAVVVAFSLVTFTSDNNVVNAKVSGDFSYDVLNNGTVEIINYNGSAENLTIPNQIDGKSVTKIGYGAFAECQSLKNVVIPNTVVTIGYWAFSKCTQLETITIPNSVVTLGNSAFFGCSSLSEVSIPNSLKAVSNGTFSDCTSLSSVVLPTSIEYIEDSAFSNCTSLKQIDIPTSVKAIGSSSFANCIQLKTVVLPDSVVSIGTGALSGCIELTDLTLPKNLVSLGQYAFKDCINLSEIELPESLEALGYATFNGCSSLTKINIPSKIETISDSTFSGCSNLKEITIPDNVTKIGEYVFSGCVGLKSISIPDSVTEIGAFTFSFCSELEQVKLPTNLKVLSAGMFTDCMKLDSVIIPNGVSELEGTVFSGCISLKSVILPNTVSKLGSRVFSDCKEVVISVPEGSASHSYAINNDVPFKLIDSGLNLDKKAVSMKIGATESLVAILSPYNIVDSKTVTWTSSNTAVAIVSDTGVITAKATGTTTITAKLASGLSTTCVVTVDNIAIPITKVELNESSLTLLKGTSQGLRATITPVETTDNRTLTWESSNTEIATVTSTGVITARKPGTVVISVKSSNGKTATCSVTILSEIKTVSLNVTALDLEIGMKQSLRATINPDDTTDDKTLTWVSSNTNVATVNENGQVTGVAGGVATITVKTVNGRTASCKISVNTQINKPIQSVSLDKTTLTIEETATQKLVASINPTDTTDDKTLAWTSSDNSIASVNNGTITGVKVGTATITVTTSNGKTATCLVTVTKKVVPITGVSLDKTTLSVVEAATQNIVATINPTNTTDDKTLAWTSSDNSIASVSNGTITGVKAGTATITVTTSNGKTATCLVTVTKKVVPITGVSLDKTKATIKVAGIEQFVASILPGNTSETYELVWSSSNDKVVSVDQNGKVKGIAAGSATISVSVKGTSFSATATVVVEPTSVVDTDMLEMLVDVAKETIDAQDLYLKNDAWDIFVETYANAVKAMTSDNQTLIDQCVDELNEALMNIRFLPDETALKK